MASPIEHKTVNADYVARFGRSRSLSLECTHTLKTRIRHYSSGRPQSPIPRWPITPGETTDQHSDNSSTRRVYTQKLGSNSSSLYSLVHRQTHHDVRPSHHQRGAEVPGDALHGVVCQHARAAHQQQGVVRNPQLRGRRGVVGGRNCGAVVGRM